MAPDPARQSAQLTPRNRLFSLAFLAHLAVPAFLIVDCAGAELRGPFPAGRGVALVAGLSVLWLAGGIALLLAGRRRPALARRLYGPLLTIWVVYAMAALGEGALDFLGIVSPVPGLQTPFKSVVNHMNPALNPGVSGPKRFTINALGLRGPMPPRGRGIYRAVAIGGSITLCPQLDDAEAWPYAAMQSLNASQNRARIWIGNASTAGATTLNAVVVTQWLPGIVPADMWIFFPGGNDLQAALALDGKSSEDFLEKESGYEGELPPGVHWRTKRVYPVYRRLELLMMIHRAVDTVKLRWNPPAKPPLLDLMALRKRRAEGTTVPLPDLSVPLAEYSHRLELLAGRCRDVRVRCLFLTEPTLWQEHLPTQIESRFWLGYFGPFQHPKGYISSGDMGRAMDRYNAALLDACRRERLESFDLAARFPKDPALFTDEVHFSEAGAGLMTRLLRDYLLSTPPFNGSVAERSGL